MLKFGAAFLVILLFEQGHCQSSCDEATRFRCRDGLCLSKGLLCNGIQECEYVKNESKCGNVTHCPKQQRLVRLNNYYWNGKCNKPCNTDDDCGKRRCVCDDECGFSCVSLRKKCNNHPPEIEHMGGHNVYERSLTRGWRSVKRSAPYLYRSFVHYKCLQGYQLDGPAPRCNGRGRWSRERPRCVLSNDSECHDGFLYKGNCYFAVMQRVRNITGADRLCINNRGRLSDILDVDHQAMFEAEVQRKASRTRDVWTAMTYRRHIVRLSNGNRVTASNFRWHIRSPRRGHFTGIIMRAYKSRSFNNGLYNYSKWGSASGALCKKQK